MTGSPDLASLGASLLNSAAERDQANLDRLIRIKENIERQARKEVERLHKMVDKREIREMQVESIKESALKQIKDDHKKENHRRRYIRELRAR
jgi:hypothetical protein